MRVKYFGTALLSTATVLTLAACGSSGGASSPDYELTDVSFPLEEDSDPEDVHFQFSLGTGRSE